MGQNMARPGSSQLGTAIKHFLNFLQVFSLMQNKNLRPDERVEVIKVRNFCLPTSPVMSTYAIITAELIILFLSTPDALYN